MSDLKLQGRVKERNQRPKALNCEDQKEDLIINEEELQQSFKRQKMCRWFTTSFVPDTGEERRESGESIGWTSCLWIVGLLRTQERKS